MTQATEGAAQVVSQGGRWSQSEDATLILQNEKMLHSMARKGYARVMGMGLSMEYEDVFQEMCLFACKARTGFDPSRGFKFSTYMVPSVWSQFNKLMDRMAREHFGLGLVNVEDIGTEGQDQYELMACSGELPDEAFERKERFRKGVRALDKKSQAALVCLMRQIERPDTEERSLRKIMDDLQISRAKQAGVRKKLFDMFEVGS